MIATRKESGRLWQHKGRDTSYYLNESTTKAAGSTKRQKRFYLSKVVKIRVNTAEAKSILDADYDDKLKIARELCSGIGATGHE